MAAIHISHQRHHLSSRPEKVNKSCQICGFIHPRANKMVALNISSTASVALRGKNSVKTTDHTNLPQSCSLCPNQVQRQCKMSLFHHYRLELMQWSPLNCCIHNPINRFSMKHFIQRKEQFQAFQCISRLKHDCESVSPHLFKGSSSNKTVNQWIHNKYTCTTQDISV